MTYIFDGHIYTIRLTKDERLTEALQAFFEAEPETTGTLSGIGGAQEVTLGFYDLNAKEYRWKTFTRLLEVAAVQGTIAFGPDGKLMFHLHGTLSDDTYQTIGGHIKDLVVGGTLELILNRSYPPLRRQHDDQTGLNLLKI